MVSSNSDSKNVQLPRVIKKISLSPSFDYHAEEQSKVTLMEPRDINQKLIFPG
jgi:hypothetical protein